MAGNAAISDDMRWITRRSGVQLDLILCAVYTVMIIAGLYTRMASLAAFVLVALAFFCLPLENIIGQLLYLLPFATVFKLDPSSTSLMTYLELYVALLLVLRHPRFRLRELNVFLLLFASVLIGSVYADNLAPLLIIKLFASLLLFLCFKRSDHRKELPNYLTLMALGLLVSSAVAYAWRGSAILQRYIDFTRIVKLTADGYVTTRTVRFSGLGSDPNYYAVNLCIAIIGLLMLINYKRIQHRTAAYGLVVGLVVFGLLTVSKSFLLMLVLILLYAMASGIRQRRYGLTILVVAAGAVLILLALSGRSEALNLMLMRLTQQGTNQDLTTGRTEIWERYFTYLGEHPFGLVFGSGLGSAVIGFSAHNTYIEMLASLGVVGSGLFLVLLGCLMSETAGDEGQTAALRRRTGHRSLGNYSLLLVLLVMYFFLSMLTWIDLPFQLYLCFCFLHTEWKTPADTAENAAPDGGSV